MISNVFDFTYMRHLVVKFTRILVVAVDTWRWFPRLVHFGWNIAHRIVQRLGSPLIIRCSVTNFVILSIMLGNYNALAHPALERRAIILTCDGRMLSTKDWTFVILLVISPVNTACSTLRIVVRGNCRDDRRWSTIYGIAPIVRHVDWWVVSNTARYGAAILLLQIVMHLDFLMGWLLGWLIEIRLLWTDILFISLGWLWLKRPEGIGRQATDCLDIILNLWGYFVVSDEGAANRSLCVALVVLTLALPLIALSKLILRWVIILHVLNILVFVHGEWGNAIHGNLVALNVRSWVSSRFWCAVCAARVARPRLPMRSDELDSTSTSLVDEVFHERVASLLTTTLSHTVLMLCLRVHLTLSLFPAIFQIIRCRTLIHGRKYKSETISNNFTYISKNLRVLNGAWKLGFSLMVFMQRLAIRRSTHIIRVSIHFLKQRLYKLKFKLTVMQIQFV